MAQTDYGDSMTNETIGKPSVSPGPDNFIRVWHLAVVGLGLAAWLTGDLADDYKQLAHSGFILHGILGMMVAVAFCLYLGYGIAGPRHARFASWFPFTGERLRHTGADLATLFKGRLPKHTSRQGLAGMVQFCGMLIFCWLATTGALLSHFIEPGRKAQGLAHAIKGAHEIGEVLLPLYLGIHIGAVIAHALTGNQVWRKIFFFPTDGGSPRTLE